MRATLVLSTVALLASGCSLIFDADKLKGTSPSGLDGGSGDDAHVGGGDDLGNGNGSDGGGGADLARGTCLMGDGGASLLPKGPFAIGGTTPNGLKLGDFNTDGKLDLVTSNEDTKNVSVLLGAGDGTFSLAATSPVFACAYPVALTVGDFDGVKGDDIFVVCYDTPSSGPAVSTSVVLLNDGAGGFKPAATVNPQGSRPQEVFAGDFNHDTKMDIAILNYTSKQVSLLFGDGTGAFPTHDSIALDASLVTPDGLGVGLLNNDAIPDLIVSDYDAGIVQVFLSQSATPGKFVGQTPITGLFFLGSPRVADVDGDHQNDLLIVQGYTPKSDLTYFRNAGNGVFPSMPTATYAVGYQSVAIDTGDFDCDGKTDVAACGFFTNAALIVRQRNGAFSPPAPTAMVNTSNALVVGDFDRDGFDDIAVSQRADSVVTVLLTRF